MPDEPIEPAQQPEIPAPDPETPPEPPTPADPWDDPAAARREIEKLRRESAKYRTAAKELEPLAAKAREAEEAQKTEAERLSGQLAEAQKRAAVIQQRAVRAEVRALAAGDFADPEDASAFLDLDSYGSDGEIDADRIREDLAELLKRKPHLGKTPEWPRRPAPDRTQGSSGNGHRSPSDPAAQFAAFLKQGLERGR